MTMIMTKIKVVVGAILMLAFFIAFAVTPAFATSKPTNDQDQEQGQGQKQGQQQQTVVNIGGGGEGAGTLADATTTITSDDDMSIDASDNSRVENNSSNVVLVPNNNTESCLRVWGLGWGNASGSGGIGIPVRSKKCDYEQAADDAFAAGERDLGWFWKCENPNLYKSFKGKGESNDSAKLDCFDKMTKGVSQTTTIRTLEEQLSISEEERRIARGLHKESTERINAACAESKDRILAACVDK